MVVGIVRPAPQHEKSELVNEVPPQKVTAFTGPEVQALLAAASGRIKLYLLLGLNCGFTQFDIARLRRDEVDIDRGYLTRKRTKTTRFVDVPTVAYKLWSPTLDLLKSSLTPDQPDQPLALLNEDGRPLKREWIGTDGEKKRADNIRTAYERLCTS